MSRHLGNAIFAGAGQAPGGNVSDAALPFESYGVSHRGCVRLLNEDSFLMEPKSGLWLVADGMGGHEAGEVASSTIVEHLATIGVASSAPELLARFEDRLGRAHEEIRGLAKARGVTIGSTVAALLAMNGSFACFWSGDSRVYLVRDGRISQISRDHTEVQELLDKGMISPSEARSWPRRNVITRAVGVSEEIAVDFHQGQTLPGDVFVLSTDGLTAHVEDAEILEAVAAYAPQAACEKLLDTVLGRGGTDNVTIVLVRIRGVSQSDPADRTAVPAERALP
jgi:protein phosphatase